MNLHRNEFTDDDGSRKRKGLKRGFAGGRTETIYYLWLGRKRKDIL